MNNGELKYDSVRTDGPGYKEAISIISEGMTETRDAFFKIGWHLKYIKDREMYRKEGYKNIYEFAFDKFGISKSNASRFINVCIAFSVGNNSCEPDERYKRFSQSQLVEMQTMRPEDREKVTPEMSIKAIREIKKNQRQKSQKEKLENTHNIAGEDPYAASHMMDNAETIFHAKGVTRPKLPKLINDDERREWLRNVEKWGIWYEDQNIRARYYKYDFPDGSRLIAVKYKDSFPDGRKGGTPIYGEASYHVLYSESYRKEHADEYWIWNRDIYSNKIATIDELVNFLKQLQRKADYERYWKTVEFDTESLEDKCNMKPYSLTRKYIEFYEKKGYIPQFFQAKNCTEIKDFAPTLTTSSGGFMGVGAVVTFYLFHNIKEIWNDETIERNEREDRIRKLMQASDPKHIEYTEREFEKELGLWKKLEEVVYDETLDEDARVEELNRRLQTFSSKERRFIHRGLDRISNLDWYVNEILRIDDMQKNELEGFLQTLSTEETEFIENGCTWEAGWNAAYSIWNKDYEIWKAACALLRDFPKTGEETAGIGKVRFKVKRLSEAEHIRLMGIECTEEDIEKVKESGITSTDLYQMSGNALPPKMLLAFLEAIPEEVRMEK